MLRGIPTPDPRPPNWTAGGAEGLPQRLRTPCRERQAIVLGCSHEPPRLARSAGQPRAAQRPVLFSEWMYAATASS